MGICEQCTHFRRVRPVSQLLALTISTHDATIVNALSKMGEDEQQLHGYEVQHVTQKSNSHDENWDFRPVMSTYCGKHEADGRYLIHGIKNFGGRCREFESGRSEKHSCKDCRFRITAGGFQKDLQTEKAISKSAILSISVGASASMSENLLSKHLDGAASRKASEIRGAYATKGHMMTEPQYLDYCAKFSGEEDFVICVLENSQQTCKGWTIR